MATILAIKKNEFRRDSQGKLFDTSKRKVFYNFVKSYSHAKEKDLVNSQLGIINVWCHSKTLKSSVFYQNKKKALEILKNFNLFGFNSPKLASDCFFPYEVIYYLHEQVYSQKS
jgi:hypothetical protein